MLCKYLFGREISITCQLNPPGASLIIPTKSIVQIKAILTVCFSFLCKELLIFITFHSIIESSFALIHNEEHQLFQDYLFNDIFE